jgi:uncharacterized membrane protein
VLSIINKSVEIQGAFTLVLHTMLKLWVCMFVCMFAYSSRRGKTDMHQTWHAYSLRPEIERRRVKTPEKES